MSDDIPLPDFKTIGNVIINIKEIGSLDPPTLERTVKFTYGPNLTPTKNSDVWGIKP